MSDLDAHLPGIVAGDLTAFTQWVVGAEPRLRLSLSRFAESADTEAVVQETLLRIWQVASRVTPDGQGDSLLRYAIRMSRNLAIDQLRARRAALPGDEAVARLADADVPPPCPPDPLLRRTLEVCRHKLPRKPGLALTARLSSQGEQADSDLAEALGMRLNTFLQNVGRARKLLLACLAKAGVVLQEVGL